MQNFLNVNEVFPIIELIRREIKKYHFDNNRSYGFVDKDYTEHDIKEIQVFRQPDEYESISSVITTYFDDTVETVTLNRGYTPPLPPTEDDYEYINANLLTGFTLVRQSPLGDCSFNGDIIRENGYGRITGLKMTVI